MLKALVVDDHPFIRTTVKILLEQENIEVIAEASNGADAVQLAREFDPDLIILDISLPKLDGLEVLARLSSFQLRSKILILTSYSAEFYLERCINAGAVGFVSKANDLNDLTKGVKMVMSGYTFFPHLNNSSVRRIDGRISDLELIKSLTDREMLVLQMLAQGFNNIEIGESMFLSNKTISAYKTRLLEKLQAKSVVALADFVKRNNLI